MAKYFYFFDNEEDARAWEPPQNQSWVAYYEEFGVGYSSNSVMEPSNPDNPIEET